MSETPDIPDSVKLGCFPFPFKINNNDLISITGDMRQLSLTLDYNEENINGNEAPIKYEHWQCYNKISDIVSKMDMTVQPMMPSHSINIPSHALEKHESPLDTKIVDLVLIWYILSIIMELVSKNLCI